MARKPRIHAPGLLYHVLCRGNQKQQIFFDEQDYKAYLHRLAEVHSDLPFRLYAYALMKNHVHMLIEVGEIPLSQIMQILQQRYTQYFNSKYKKTGHLFEGRYKAIICQRDEYLLELVRYINLNPVRAKIVREPSEYPWTSHKSYLAKKCDPWLDRNAILMQFGKGIERAQQKYLQFVRDGLNEGHRDELYVLKEQQVLGDDDFLNTLPLGASADEVKKDSTKRDLKEIETNVCKEFGIDEKEFRLKGARRSSSARGIFCVMAKDHGYTLTEIAKYLKCSDDNLSHLRRRTLNLSKDKTSIAAIFAKFKNWGQA